MAASLVVLAACTALALWLVYRKRPTAEELERARRLFLVQSGRIVDGMLLDICAVEAEDGRTLSMLLYSYRIGGVDYECSQDITDMRDVVDAGEGAGRVSVLGALPAGEPAELDRGGGRVVGPALRAAGAADV